MAIKPSVIRVVKGTEISFRRDGEKLKAVIRDSDGTPVQRLSIESRSTPEMRIIFERQAELFDALRKN